MTATTMHLNPIGIMVSSCPHSHPGTENVYYNRSNLINPLLMDHVLENIFWHMEREFLYKMRLVCKQWNYNAKRIVTQKANEVTFGLQSLKDFIEFWKGNEEEPFFLNFKFLPDVLAVENYERIEKFVEISGPSMESLTIWPGWLKKPREKFDGYGPLYLPRLKILKIEDHEWNFLPGRHIDTHFIKAVVKAAHNVTQFNFIMPRLGTVDNDNRRRMELLVSLLIGNTMPNLRTLKLELVINDDLLKSLTLLKLHLENVHIVFSFLRQGNFERNYFSAFLSNQKNTLKKLSIFGLDDIHFKIQFPCMEVLRTLEIDGNIPSSRTKLQPHLEKNRVQLSRFSYRMNFPKLQRLVLSTWAKRDDWDQFFPENNVVETLQELQLPYYMRDRKFIRRISFCFPNLKKLELIYSPEAVPILEAVFETLCNIEELKILHCLPRKLPSTNIDHILTGIPREECQRIRSGRIYNFPSSLELCCKPSIVNLKRLRKLDLSAMLCQTEISDVTAFLAFMKMEMLETLLIQRSKIQEQSLQELSTKFTLKLH